jgi:hypothetical protein
MTEPLSVNERASVATKQAEDSALAIDLTPWRTMEFAEGGPHDFPEPMGGYYWREGDALYIPVVITKWTALDGRGAVAAVIARAMETMRVVKFPTVVSARLDAMLARRGFVEETEPFVEVNDVVEVRVWRRPSPKTDGQIVREATE